MGLDVTSVLTVGRYWRLHPLLQPPPPHPPISLCAFLSFIFSLKPGAAYPAFTTSYPTPPHTSTPILPPQTHTLTYEHTHSFNLPSCLPPPPPSPLLHLCLSVPLRDHWKQLAGHDLSYRCSGVSPDTQTW